MRRSRRPTPFVQQAPQRILGLIERGIAASCTWQGEAASERQHLPIAKVNSGVADRDAEQSPRRLRRQRLDETPGSSAPVQDDGGGRSGVQGDKNRQMLRPIK